MKKNILKIAFVVVIAFVAGYNMYNSQKEELTLSDLMMDNVDALAQTENGSGYSYVNCDGHNITCTGNGSYKCCVG